MIPRRRSAAPAPVGLIVLVLSLAGTLVSLMHTLVLPLILEFPAILGTSAENASWLLTSTLLTSAVATPIVCKLADMFGKRRMMLVCLVALLAGSVLGGLSDSLPALIAARALQGVSSALIPVGISIMRDHLPAERVASAVSLMSATLGIGAAAGLPLSGVIHAHAGWHALFWVSAGSAAVMLILVPTVVPESRVRSRGRFDLVGAGLLSAALTALLLTVSKGGDWGWRSEEVVLGFVIGLAVLGLWVPWELRVGQPLVDLRTSARRPVLLTNVASLFVGFAMYVNMMSTTMFLQMPPGTGYGLGLDELHAGLAMLPGGLAMVAMAPVSATVTRRHGARICLVLGSGVMAVGYVTRVALNGSVAEVVTGATVVSVGAAVAFAAMPNLIMRSVPITETAEANGLNTLLRSIGTSASSAVVATVLATATLRVAGTELPTLVAFDRSLWVAAVVALLATALAACLPRATPASVGRPARSAARPVGTATEVVATGRVTDQDGRPVRPAVVSVVRTDGQQLDWARATNDGTWSVVLPEPGRYLVICSADGWAPTAALLSLPADGGAAAITLVERLTVWGTVTRGGRPLPCVLVTLTSHSGEAAGAARTLGDGSYELPLPAAGRYTFTVYDPGCEQTWAHHTVMTSQRREFSVDLS
jgi:MFS family permease